MPYSYTREQIEEYWSWCGEIESLDMLTFPDSGRFRGIAFITFTTQEGYEAALACDGEMVDGQTLKVRASRLQLTRGMPVRCTWGFVDDCTAHTQSKCPRRCACACTHEHRHVHMLTRTHVHNNAHRPGHVLSRVLAHCAGSKPENIRVFQGLQSVDAPEPLAHDHCSHHAPKAPVLHHPRFCHYLQVDKCKAAAAAPRRGGSIAAAAAAVPPPAATKPAEQETPSKVVPSGGNRGGAAGSSGRPGKTPGYNVAYVGNIAFEVTPEELKEVFADCGVKLVRLHTDQKTGRSKGYAHVHFEDDAGLDRWANILACCQAGFIWRHPRALVCCGIVGVFVLQQKQTVSAS